MFRLAILLALLITFVAPGCGGSDDESDPAPSSSVQGSESARSDDGSASNEAKKENDDAAERSSNEDEDDAEPKTDEAQEDSSAVIETLVRSALEGYDLTVLDIQVLNDGRAVTAIVGRQNACNFVASQEMGVVAQIKRGVPGLKSVRFEVEGTGQELGYYVVGCKTPDMPSGRGQVVFEHAGVNGPYTSKRFRIKGKRWALEWVNETSSLTVLVVPVGGESKGEYFKPVSSQKRESDRYDYKGRGIFKLKLHGAGGWRVRVKDIR